MNTVKREELAQKIIKRYNKLVLERTNFEEFFRDVRNYIRPTRQAIDGAEITVAQRFTNKRFDSTASEASRIMATSMQNALIPQSSRWFGLKIPDGHPMSMLNNFNPVSAWFQDASMRIFNSLSGSNFYTVMGEAFYDFVTFGTINILIEEKDLKDENFAGFNFKGIPVGRFVFDEDYTGKTDTVYWEYTRTARQMHQEFEKKLLPDAVIECLEENPDKQFTVIKCIKPNEDHDYGKADSFEFISFDVEKGSKLVVKESGFSDLPFVVARFERVTGELWGRSPADIAMPDIISLNRLREMELKALSKAVDPPILAPDENILGTFRLNPNAINFTRDPERWKFMRFEGRLDFSSLKANELKQSIRNIYLADQLILPEKLNMTAEEIITIRQQQQRLLGPQIARMEAECLGPIITRCFNIMLRSGGFANPPEELGGLDEIDIQYLGPIAKTQRLEGMQSAQAWVQQLVSVASVKPEVLDHLDSDALADYIADMTSVPHQVRASDEAIAKSREERAKVEAENRQMAMNQQIAETANKAAPAVKELSEVPIGLFQ